MSKITFSISELIEQSWLKFKEQPRFWILITMLSIAVGYFGDYGLSIEPENLDISFTSLEGLIMSILSLYLTASITLMYIKYMRGKSVSFHDLLAIDFNKFAHYIIVVLFSFSLIPQYQYLI